MQKNAKLRGVSAATSTAILCLTGIVGGAQETKPAAQPSAQPAGGATNAVAPAATAPSAAATKPAPSATEQWIQSSKNPAPWFKWGGDLRLRNEYLNNGQSLGSTTGTMARRAEQDYFRFRGRLWMSVTPITNVTANVRLSSEPRVWMKEASYSPYKGKSGTDWTEGVIDSFNVEWKEPVGLPAKITVGRQDIMLGEGWLFGDGTPYDGSWTYFLDAARITYDLKDQQTTIDAIGIIQNAHDSDWLPAINSQNRYGSDQNERGAVLNIANKTIKELNIDGYFIYKNDSRVGSADPYNMFGDDADIYTLGGRLSGLVADNWKYYVEGAYQFGQKKDPNVVNGTAPTADFRNIDAFGVNNKLTYMFKDPLNNQASFSYEFLSGDNPGTGNDEMFDVLWGRYPRFSELYNVYSYATESRVVQTANLHRIGPAWSITPLPKLDFSASYSVLLADQSVPTRVNPKYSDPSLFSGTGTFRGQYVQSVLKYKFNNHVSGHLWAEFVMPGDFYTHSDLMSFLRAEMMFTY